MEGIDTFENPFLGMLGNIKKNLGEGDARLVVSSENPNCDGEQHQYNTFVKEKTIIIGYVHDLIKFAAKLQEIDLISNKILSDSPPEETKEEEELRIKSDRECCIIAARINGLVSIYPSNVSHSFLSIHFLTHFLSRICSLRHTKNSQVC